MQAHLTKATSSVTYLLKMQSRAPWPPLSELTDSCWAWAGWVWLSCCGKAVPGESLDHSGADSNVSLWVESWVFTVFCCESQSLGKHCPTEVKHIAASLKSLKNRFGTARLFITELVLDREQSEQCSGKVHWRSFYTWPIKKALQFYMDISKEN